MRLTGTLRTWHDDRGFGFIAPTQGGAELFVHISALPRDGARPTIGEKLTYEIGRGKDGKPQAVQVQRQAIGDWHKASHARPHERRPARTGLGKRVVVLLLLGALGVFGVHRYQTRVPPPAQLSAEAIAEAPIKAAVPHVQPTEFRCDGRKYCSQMTSCAEAKQFLKNCPGVQMDGNHDGVPCEQQWCTSPWAK